MCFAATWRDGSLGHVALQAGDVLGLRLEKAENLVNLLLAFRLDHLVESLPKIAGKGGSVILQFFLLRRGHVWTYSSAR
jgi:hypothetical protein